MQSTLDEYLLTVGKAVQHASIVELVVFNAFMLLSGCQIPTARAIFYAVDSAAVRGKMLKRLAELDGGRDAKIVKDLLAAQRRVNDARNELAHSMMMEHGGNLSRLSAKRMTARVELVTGDSMQKLLGETQVGRDEALQHYQALCAARGVEPALAG